MQGPDDTGSFLDSPLEPATNGCSDFQVHRTSSSHRWLSVPDQEQRVKYQSLSGHGECFFISIVARLLASYPD